MKSLTIIKNISHLLSRGSAVAYFIYILAIAFMRAANLQPLSKDDIILLTMFGTIVGILFIAEYSLRVICSALRRQYKISVREA